MNSLSDRYSLETMQRAGELQLSEAETARNLALPFAFLNGIGGDYLEFGVFKGAGLIQAYHTHRSFLAFTEVTGDDVAWVTERMRRSTEYQQNMQKLAAMRFVAFDSFEGLSTPTEKYESLFAKGDYAASLDDFHANLRANKVPDDRVTTVKGWFKDTLNAETKKQKQLKEAAIVYVDCDLYEPAQLVLEFVTDLLVDGSVIIFDDWWLFKGHPERGEQKAFSEWRANHQELRISELYNKLVAAFVVHR